MIDPNFVRSEKTFKIFALCTGILIGSFYASFGRSIARQWIFSEKKNDIESSTIATSSLKMADEYNETAAFLVADDTKLADELARQIPVLCWIHRDDIQQKLVESIKNTWGARCKKILFLINHETNLTDVISLKVNSSYQPTVEDAYNYIYKNHFDDYDWFLKTDGDTYVVVENLRFLLYAYDPTQAISFGHRESGTYIIPSTTASKSFRYYSEKAGYVLSKEAMRRLNEAFHTILLGCGAYKKIKMRDDERIGICLDKANVVMAKNTDANGKKLFFEENLDDFLLPKIEVNFPYPWYSDYKVDHRLDVASNYSITFHGVTGQHMYVMEYLIYQLRPYGVEYETPSLPRKVPMARNE